VLRYERGIVKDFSYQAKLLRGGCFKSMGLQSYGYDIKRILCWRHRGERGVDLSDTFRRAFSAVWLMELIPRVENLRLCIRPPFRR
jgi:hypothetical protein